MNDRLHASPDFNCDLLEVGEWMVSRAAGLVCMWCNSRPSTSSCSRVDCQLCSKTGTAQNPLPPEQWLETPVKNYINARRLKTVNSHWSRYVVKWKSWLTIEWSTTQWLMLWTTCDVSRSGLIVGRNLQQVPALQRLVVAFMMHWLCQSSLFQSSLTLYPTGVLPTVNVMTRRWIRVEQARYNAHKQAQQANPTHPHKLSQQLLERFCHIVDGICFPFIV